MAGNIIPAIAATNAIVAGLIVMAAFNVLQEEYHKCQTVSMNWFCFPLSTINLGFCIKFGIITNHLIVVREQSCQHEKTVICNRSYRCT